MQTRRLWVLGGGLIAVVAAVVVGAAIFAGSGDGSDDDDQARNEDTGGGNALGTCLEGATDCVDTVDTPGGSDGGGLDEKPVDPDQPVVTSPPEDGAPDIIDCTAPDNVQACEARATEVALSDLATRLGVDATAIAVVSIEEAVWDGCMGVTPPEGRACTEIGILGYKIILEHAGATYEYHTDQGTKAVLAE